MKIYCISGIGADHRMFRHILAPEGHELVEIGYITPIEGESLRDYSIRLSAGIDTSEPFALLGLSLGGIICVEIARRLSPVGTIIIGSIPISAQMPGYFKLAGRLHLAQFISPSLLKSAAILKRLFSNESPEDKRVIRKMIRDGNSIFIKWALQAVLEWDNEQPPAPLWHIHGTRDEVFPIGYTKPTHIIRKGGHTLVMSHPAEINRILREAIG